MILSLRISLNKKENQILKAIGIINKLKPSPFKGKQISKMFRELNSVRKFKRDLDRGICKFNFPEGNEKY